MYNNNERTQLSVNEDHRSIRSYTVFVTTNETSQII